MIEGSIIYIIIHETNHLNRLLNHVGESSKKNSTPRNEKIPYLDDKNPEGGRYMCASLFGENYTFLTLEQAMYIGNIDNWEPVLEENNQCQGKAVFVNFFKKKFTTLNNSDTDSEKIRMMNNNIIKIKDTLCYKPHN